MSVESSMQQKAGLDRIFFQAALNFFSACSVYQSTKTENESERSFLKQFLTVCVISTAKLTGKYNLQFLVHCSELEVSETQNRLNKTTGEFQTDLNLPPNPFGILNTMEIIAQTRDDNNDRDSPESPEPSMPSPISTPPVNVSAFNSWETSHTTSNDDTFYSEDEPRRVYWTPPLGETFQSDDEPRRIYLLSQSPSPPPPRAQKRKLSLGMSFPKEGGVSQHVCEACGQTIPSKDTPGPSNRI